MTALIVTEGAQDVTFLQCVLCGALACAPVKLTADVPPELRDIIPKSFPNNAKGDFTVRVRVPCILRRDGAGGRDWIVISDAGGTGAVGEDLAAHRGSAIRWTAVGVMVDADGTQPAQVFAGVVRSLRRSDWPEPSEAGVVHRGTPRTGVFVLPDNRSTGTLEDVLSDCADVNYPSLLAAGREFVAGARTVVTALPNREGSRLRKRAGPQKAALGALSNLLRPGLPMQASLQETRWLTDAALQVPRVRELVAFLEALLDVA